MVLTDYSIALDTLDFLNCHREMCMVPCPFYHGKWTSSMNRTSTHKLHDFGVQCRIDVR